MVVVSQIGSGLTSPPVECTLAGRPQTEREGLAVRRILH
jgi:hypothetical protein